MRCATEGPTRGSSCSCWMVAVLTLTTPGEAAAEAASGASRLTTSRMPKALRRCLFMTFFLLGSVGEAFCDALFRTRLTTALSLVVGFVRFVGCRVPPPCLPWVRPALVQGLCHGAASVANE